MTPEDEQRVELARILRRIGWLMLSIAFGGGALFGLIAASLGLPGTYWAPAILVASGIMALLLKSAERRR